MGGVWLTLALLLAGPLWLWELNESWSVPPVVGLVSRPMAMQPGDAIGLWHEAERPSLNWYLGRRVISAEKAEDLDPGAAAVVLLSREEPSPAGWTCRLEGRSADLGLYRCQPLS